MSKLFLTNDITTFQHIINKNLYMLCEGDSIISLDIIFEEIFNMDNSFEDIKPNYNVDIKDFKLYILKNKNLFLSDIHISKIDDLIKYFLKFNEICISNDSLNLKSSLAFYELFYPLFETQKVFDYSLLPIYIYEDDYSKRLEFNNYIKWIDDSKLSIDRLKFDYYVSFLLKQKYNIEISFSNIIFHLILKRTFDHLYNGIPNYFLSNRLSDSNYFKDSKYYPLIIKYYNNNYIDQTEKGYFKKLKGFDDLSEQIEDILKIKDVESLIEIFDIARSKDDKFMKKAIKLLIEDK